MRFSCREMPRFLYVAVLLCSFAFLEGCKSFVIQPRSWDYKGHEIGYEVSHKIKPDAETSEMDIRDKEKEPVLLLNGFGVGSFHQHRLIPRLLEQEQDRIIYGIDYLGQGRSWPRACQDGDSEAEKGLRYDAEMWIDQVVTFIEEVVLPEHEINGKGPTKVHLIGNSIGGHLAAHLSLLRPDLVESICLLNPTPVWGLNLPGWCGHLPAPAIPKKIGRYLFDRIRDLTIIEKYLESAYARREAFDEELMHQIRGCTLGNGGHAAFASILWSPPLKESSIVNMSFDECLSSLECDVLLMFGRDDPWCKPAFAKKMLQALDKREPGKVHRYIEIENAGHCPNHEAPQAVARVFHAWVGATDRRENGLILVNGEKEALQEEWGETAIRELKGEQIPLGFMDKVATTFV